MGEIKWTKDQKKIIDLRDAGILVSAAAGSGKTAVLIERIFERIRDSHHPVNVDQFVIVTFTQAAAAQMKERLRERIEQALEEDPGNVHLQKQIGFMAEAHISTVHSFCNYVIQNYFHRIGLDPAYKQGTQSELSLLQKEVLGEVLEEEYEVQSTDFVELASMKTFHRSDEKMEDMIRSIYEKAMSEPFPKQWLEQMKTLYLVKDVEEWEETELVQYLIADCHKKGQGLYDAAEKMERICERADGPYMYLPAVNELRGICEDILSADKYQNIRSVLKDLKFARLSTKKDDTVNADLRSLVKEIRDNCKKELSNLRDQYFFQTASEHMADGKEMGRKIGTLIRLTQKFMDAYEEKKRERNLVDFNDLEQLALKILLPWDEEKKAHVRSEAAQELSEHFEEIMIDEYQDSNRVQEAILTAISREGQPGQTSNIFMVGDVKQSIYRFRNACPELFAGKLATYGTEEGDACRRIDLHQNFRSRGVVLEGTNRVFEKVMREDIGGVEYDEAAMLQVGRKFLETKENVANDIDVCVITDGGNAEKEGCLAANKILEMTGENNPLYIEEGDGLRKVCYRDIVILARSTKSAGQAYFDALTEAGIPVVMEHSQGFYDTREIQLMSQMLQVIDNPRMDYPLAGVLCSPMFDFTEEDLAVIRAENKKIFLYESLLQCEQEEFKEKIERFLNMLAIWREKTVYAPVAELLQDIYDGTGIYDSVRMMKDGAQRIANMDSLMEQAREFDGSTYHGLHQFVRYINKIREQQEELGEVNIVGEEENVVRIMTIHKSKGLEFPVCMVLGMGKKFGSDNTAFLTIESKFGIASKLIDNETRTTKETLYQNALKQLNSRDDLGEEMRVLYVAMTRAKEKLILIGSRKEISATDMDYLGRSQIKNYFDMVLPAVLEYPELFHLETWEGEEIIQSVAWGMLQENLEREALYNFDTSIVYDETMHQYLEKMDRQEEIEVEELPVKVSVSDLKVQSMEEMELQDFTVLTHEEEETDMPVPAFMQVESKESSAHQGAAYGTIWHQVMAYLDFEKTNSVEEIKEAVQELVKNGRLHREDTSVLNYYKLYHFFQSNLGKSMREAENKGKLHREQPFVMGKPANEIFPGRKEKEMVLVQGIIDGYYETEKGIVLMDYKTDSLKKGDESQLIDRYKTQMELYKKALENMTEMPVIECVLYSFSLEREVVCPCD